ncbi:hypothetical protein QCA50_005680 [Cerrena zonata]|uniref:Uncharacterized protein n=1 Tax=Cerrena zonata TaxID=2478898 RepID=A0AAW0GKX5_9APHY
MHFSNKLTTIFSKKTKQAGPLVFQLAPHHWEPTPLPSGPQPSSPSTSTSASTSTSSFTDTPPSSPGASSRIRLEEDLTLHEYQMFTARARLNATDPIDEDDRQLGHKHHMFLIPLDMAARLDVIKYRMEGFEMQEHRNHILDVIRGD